MVMSSRLRLHRLLLATSLPRASLPPRGSCTRGQHGTPMKAKRRLPAVIGRRPEVRLIGYGERSSRHGITSMLRWRPSALVADRPAFV